MRFDHLCKWRPENRERINQILKLVCDYIIQLKKLKSQNLNKNTK